MDTFPDLGSLSDVELKELIEELKQQEHDISYQRRILHGKIDILRAELVNRLQHKHENGEDVISGADVERLSEILANRHVGLTTAQDPLEPGLDIAMTGPAIEREPERMEI